MIIFVDIDGTICTTPKNRNYEEAKPIKKNIKKINDLYDKGNRIIYWTARGSGTGIDWKEATLEQMKEWDVKYHEIKFDKPVYDLFIDDRAINIKIL